MRVKIGRLFIAVSAWLISGSIFSMESQSELYVGNVQIVINLNKVEIKLHGDEVNRQISTNALAS